MVVPKTLKIIILDPYSTVLSDINEDLSNLIYTSDTNCPIVQYNLLYYDKVLNKYLPYTGNKVSYDLTLNKIYVKSA